jgi:phospholipid/cholesterol/gamma-HCH transport system substrate-binding protein
VFGAKFVDLVYPNDPSTQRLAEGQVLKSRNVSTEVNTVFQNVVAVLNQTPSAPTGRRSRASTTRTAVRRKTF